MERLIKATIHPQTTDHVNFTFLPIALILRQFLIISVQIDQSAFLSRQLTQQVYSLQKESEPESELVVFCLCHSAHHEEHKLHSSGSITVTDCCDQYQFNNQ